MRPPCETAEVLCGGDAKISKVVQAPWIVGSIGFWTQNSTRATNQGPGSIV